METSDNNKCVFCEKVHEDKGEHHKIITNNNEIYVCDSCYEKVTNNIKCENFKLNII